MKGEECGAAYVGRKGSRDGIACMQRTEGSARGVMGGEQAGGGLRRDAGCQRRSRAVNGADEPLDIFDGECAGAKERWDVDAARKIDGVGKGEDGGFDAGSAGPAVENEVGG